MLCSLRGVTYGRLISSNRAPSSPSRVASARETLLAATSTLYVEPFEVDALRRTIFVKAVRLCNRRVHVYIYMYVCMYVCQRK
jgi:hypothetical protein